MDVARGDDQERLFGDVGKRVDFVPPANAQGASAEEKERHIGAERGGNFHKAMIANGSIDKAQITTQSGGGIAGTAAQAATCGDGFAQFNFDTGADLEFAAQGLHGGVNEIFASWFAGERFAAEDVQGDAGMTRGPQPKLVM